MAALTTAEALKPRRTLKLFKGGEFLDIIPKEFGAWRTDSAGEIVIPKTPGSLADRLYSSSVARTYVNNNNRAPVMLLIAYGAAQSDLLQLHRPEACYPAIGFNLTHRRLIQLPLVEGATSIPAVELTARSGQRVEDIVYWARLGEFLPQTAGQQRRDRLSAAMQGYVGDGVLVRASALRSGVSPEFEQVAQFLGDLTKAMSNENRKALIGTERAATMRN